MKKGVKCTGSYLRMERIRSEPDANGKYKCPFCGRPTAISANLQLAAQCLARHNKPKTERAK